MKTQSLLRFLLALAVLTLAWSGGDRRAQAQIIIINNQTEVPIVPPRPVPPRPIPPNWPPRPIPPPVRPWTPPVASWYELREVAVSGTIRDQVAEIQVTHTLHNPNSVDLEAEYLFPIPEEGAIQNMTLMVDGKEIPGRILPKDEARGIYEEIVRRRRDPALMEYIGQGLFRTRVFPIPAGADRQITVKYTQVCRMDGHVVNFTYLMNPQRINSRPIGKFRVNLRLLSQTPIKSIYSPTHEPKIERSGDHEALITLDQQNVTQEGDFRLLYTLNEGPLGVTVLSTKPSKTEDGFFFLLASPEFKKDDSKPRPKTVLFVLDHSGSMAGEKIEQARGALRFVLNNLKPGDTFNIIVYNDRVEPYKPELQTFNEQTRAEAERFVRSIEAGGGTNIHEALGETMRLIAKDASRPSYVLFLTDGQPTVGETNELKIAQTCREANQAGARLFAFGVGYDANARLLDRLSGGNGGVSEYVRPNENLETHVATFYSRLTSPVLAGIQLKASRGELGQIYPASIPDLFEGGQLILAGRYREPGPATLNVTGKVEGREVAYEYPIKLADTDEGSTYAFVERLWAMRRIGYLIDQIDLNGQNSELTGELTRLSTKYGILTPYTSFLADERTEVYAFDVNSRQTGEALRSNLNETAGSNAQAQRAYKGSLMQGTQLSLAAPQSATAARPDAFAPGGGGGMSGRGGFGGGGGMGGGRGGRGGGGMAGGAYDPSNGTSSNGDIYRTKDNPPATTEEVQKQITDNVRQVGAKTFYRRDGVWMDSELKKDEEKGAVVLEQFSEEYFKFSRQLKPADNPYLTFSEPVIVKLAGKVYRINQPK